MPHCRSKRASKRTYRSKRNARTRKVRRGGTLMPIASKALLPGLLYVAHKRSQKHKVLPKRLRRTVSLNGRKKLLPKKLRRTVSYKKKRGLRLR